MKKPCVTLRRKIDQVSITYCDRYELEKKLSNTFGTFETTFCTLYHLKTELETFWKLLNATYASEMVLWCVHWTLVISFKWTGCTKTLKHFDIRHTDLTPQTIHTNPTIHQSHIIKRTTLWHKYANVWTFLLQNRALWDIWCVVRFVGRVCSKTFFSLVGLNILTSHRLHNKYMDLLNRSSFSYIMTCRIYVANSLSELIVGDEYGLI